MNCIKALNDAAMAEPNPDKRYMLKGAAILLREAVDALCKDATAENMTNLNGAWVYAWRVLKLATPEPDPTPKGGQIDLRRAA